VEWTPSPRPSSRRLRLQGPAAAGGLAPRAGAAAMAPAVAEAEAESAADLGEFAVLGFVIPSGSRWFNLWLPMLLRLLVCCCNPLWLRCSVNLLGVWSIYSKKKGLLSLSHPLFFMLLHFFAHLDFSFWCYVFRYTYIVKCNVCTLIYIRSKRKAMYL